MTTTRKLVQARCDAQLAEWEAKIADLRACSEKAATQAQLQASEAELQAAKSAGDAPSAVEEGGRDAIRPDHLVGVPGGGTRHEEGSQEEPLPESLK